MFRFVKKLKNPLVNKTITTITLPRSGSAYIRSVICDRTKLNPLATGTGPRMGVLVDPAELYKKAVLRPACVHGHYAPTDFNIECFHLLGIKDIVVHMRDPRDALVSWLHQLERASVKEDVPTRILHRASKDIPVNYYNLSREEKLDYLIYSLMPRMVSWISGWIKVANGDSRVNIHLTDYNQMISPVSYFNGIAQFYDLNLVFRKDDFPVLDPRDSRLNFRQGKSGTYRDEMSSKQISMASNMMDEIYQLGFIKP